MFGFFKSRPKQMSDEDYLTEFHRLIHEVEDQFAIGDTVYERLVSSMGVIEKEMNHNGGCNWQESDYAEYMETVRSILTAERSFTPDQLAEMRTRLAQLRKGMPLQEVKGILNVELAVGAFSTTWATYDYPGPMWLHGTPPPWEEAGYRLSIFFSSLDGPETLNEARLTTRTGESESWPK